MLRASLLAVRKNPLRNHLRFYCTVTAKIPTGAGGQLGSALATSSAGNLKTNQTMGDPFTAETKSRRGYGNANAALIDLGHLAVRCHEAGWEPIMQINAPLK